MIVILKKKELRGYQWNGSSSFNLLNKQINKHSLKSAQQPFKNLILRPA